MGGVSMFQKLHMSSNVFIMCLFGFMFFATSPAFADYISDFESCRDMAVESESDKKNQKNCFRQLPYTTNAAHKLLWTQRKAGATDESGKENEFCDAIKALNSVMDKRNGLGGLRIAIKNSMTKMEC